MRMIDPMVQEFEHEMATTRKMLERVPADALAWAPHAKSMSLGRLAGHIAEIPEWIAVTLLQEGLDMDPGQHRPSTPGGVKEILAAFDQNVAAGKKVMSDIRDEVLLQPWSFKVKGQEQFRMPKAAVLRSFVLNHIVHHRGQLSVYLRLRGVPLPRTYGPTADESGF